VEMQKNQEVISYTKIRELNVWTVSNLLSVLRVVMLPFIIKFLEAGDSRSNTIAVTLMLAAVLTDMFDGFVARLSGTVSSLGKILDPLADKICLGTVALYMMYARNFPLWIVVTIVTRDLLFLIGSAFLIRKKKVVFSSNMWGKVSVTVLAALILAYTLEFQWAYIYLEIAFVFFFVGSIATYYSYLRSYLRDTHHAAI